jgi:hypothetical protein
MEGDISQVEQLAISFKQTKLLPKSQQCMQSRAMR